MDETASVHPNPGWRPFQRLNRAEYASAVKALLRIDVDVTTFLPPDTISHGFDNVADAQSFSPSLMEGYLRAAGRIATLALGDPGSAPTEATYKVPRTQSQMEHIAGAPIGTRGGVSLVHVFPADGDYSFRAMLHSIPTGQLYGSIVRGEKLEVSIDGDRVALLDINHQMSEQDANGMNLQSPRVHVTAGPHRVSAAFLRQFEAPVDDILAPQDYTLADSQIGSGFGITTLPHVRDFAISGPFEVTGVSDTVSRRAVFSCRPTTAAEEAGCATEILKRLASQAYREPASDADVKALMAFFERGRKDADFEAGIRAALEALLASPRFVFRLEQPPPTARVGDTFAVADLDLGLAPVVLPVGHGARRRAGPGRLDRRLEDAGRPREAGAAHARRSALGSPGHALRAPVAAAAGRREDPPRRAAVPVPGTTRWPPTWSARPSCSSTAWSATTAASSTCSAPTTPSSTSASPATTASPNVMGQEFRRVAVPDERRGVLGHASILLLTSVADRTSPVQRGKWVMEVLLGSPPPPPPPNVPLLEETGGARDGRVLSVRERMEEHRKNPACTSCHKVIDPLGLALENFDVTGKWRIRDGDVAVDASGELYDGTKMNGPAGLRNALLKHQDAFLLSFTEHLMTYALGRRIEPFDMPAVRRVIRDASTQDLKLSAFVLGVVNTPAFRMNRVEPTDTNEPGPATGDQPGKEPKR